MALGFICFHQVASAQDPKRVDSLKSIFSRGTFIDSLDAASALAYVLFGTDVIGIFLIIIFIVILFTSYRSKKRITSLLDKKVEERTAEMSVRNSHFERSQVKKKNVATRKFSRSED